MKLRDKIQTIVQHEESDLFIYSLFCDGVSEISSRLVSLDPSKAEHFMLYNSKVYDYDSTLDIPVTDYNSDIYVIGDVVSVSRKEAGSFARNCDKISLLDFEDSQDINSLKYKSEINPGYVIRNQNNTVDLGELGGLSKGTSEILVTPVPGLKRGTTINVCQVVYNIPSAWRGDDAFNIIQNPLDNSDFELKHQDTEEILYTFPARYQHILFIYVMNQLLNTLIIKSGNVDEDEELVEMLKEAKEDFQKQYDNFFQYIAPRAQQQQQQGGQDEG